MMKKVFLLLLTVLAGCAGGPRGKMCDDGCALSAYETLEEDYLKGFLDWHPQEATGLGFHQYDGKLTDYSKTSLAAELARLKDFDRRLAALNPTRLSPRESFDVRDLRASIQREIFSFEAAGTFTRNPMTYAGVLDVSPYVKRDFAPLDYRVRAIIRILNQAPNVTAAARANLEEALPRPWLETAIEIGDGTADFLEHDLVEALPDLHDETLRGQFKAADQLAVAEMRGFVKYLKEEKLPKAVSEFALGRDQIARSLREGELITLPPERILAIGLDELRREQKLFAETAARIDPKRPPIEVFQAIQHDHPTAQNLIADTGRDLEAIRSFIMSHHLATIPSEVRPRVEETLKFERAGSFASMDSPGPFESKATEAYYYVTPVEPEWTAQQKEEWLSSFNYYTTDVVSIHEVYPGHYIQFLTMNASHATEMEKIMGSYAFVEGWAHYCEQMVLDEGFGAAAPSHGNDPVEIKAAKYRLAQLDESLLRLCRLCVAIQMHCQGMSVDEAAKFFEDNCYYGEKPARSEAMRGAFDPGYANYTLGKLMILKLRQDYQAQEGAAFTLEKFHDALLSHGMPPVPLLRELLLKDRTLWDQAL
jgi:uncharacterized protein (DUF885 family)